MCARLRQQLVHFMLLCSLVSMTGAAKAADTEIYFGGAAINRSVIGANLLFILDNSNSMDGVNIERLVAAMEDIITNINGVNVGIMSFKNGDGGSILFPVSNINALASTVVSESGNRFNNFANQDSQLLASTDTDINGTVNQTAAAINLGRTTAIVGGGDAVVQLALSDDNQDATETYNGTVIVANQDAFRDRVGVEQDRGDARDRRMAAFRFTLTPGTIPACTPITRASFTLPAFNVAVTQRHFVTISAQLSSTTAGFVANDNDISSRPVTTPFNVNYRRGRGLDIDSSGETDTTLGAGSEGLRTSLTPRQLASRSNINGFTRLREIVTTPELLTAINEVVMQGCSGDNANDGTWDESSIVLIVSHNNHPNSFRNNTFIHPGSTWPTTNNNYVTADPDSFVTPVVARLALGFVQPARPAVTPTTRLRFEGVDIPQGATISSAYLCYRPIEAQDEETYRLNIAAVAKDDSPASDVSTTSALSVGAEQTWNITTAFEAGREVCSTNQASVLVDVLQGVVNRSGWCGGNAVTLQLTDATPSGEEPSAINVQTADNNANAFRLQYGYTASATDGCFIARVNNQVVEVDDDAQQLGSTVQVNELDINISNSAFNSAGFRFRDIAIPRNTTITSANLRFTVTSDVSSGNDSVIVRGQLGDAAAFTTTENNLTGRTMTNASVTENLPADVAPLDNIDIDVTTVVQEIINDNSWSDGDNMALLLAPQTSNADYQVGTSDRDPNTAARLRITYQSTGLSDTQTVRNRLLEIVRNMGVFGDTPIQETVFEAARYWRGDLIDHGQDREFEAGTNFTDPNGTRLNAYRASHPGSYCSADSMCNGATVGTGSPGTTTPDRFGRIIPNAACNPEEDIDDPACQQLQIAGSPSYLSPLLDDNNGCPVNNHQILLSDGESSDISPVTQGGDNTLLDAYYDSILGTYSSLFTNPQCYPDNSHIRQPGEFPITFWRANPRRELCTLDIVEVLNTRDNNSVVSGTQNVSTHTVAYNLTDNRAVQFLQDIARTGGGEFRTANTTSDLIIAFNEFITLARSGSSSFSTPALATNSFNRLFSRDDIYFGMFEPNNRRNWIGNVKKYNICVSTASGCNLGDIIDANDVAATNANGLFNTNSTSFWSATVDANEIAIGGSGEEITQHYQGTAGTRVYTEATGSGATPTYLSRGASFEQAGYYYEEDTASSDDWTDSNLGYMRSQVCNGAIPADLSDTTDANYQICESRMKWLLGQRIIADDDYDINSDQRWSVADVLHSSPVVVTYGGEDTDSDGEVDNFFEKLIYTTNDGALHMINPSDDDGHEDWRYIPARLLQQQSLLLANTAGEHLYGLDITPVVDIVDHNRNGSVEIPDADNNNDTVIAYMGMRRGGNSYYALDLSGEMATTDTIITPRFLWSIHGGETPGYERLSQTWSIPVVTNIQTTTGSRKVLIFGGGYDLRLDEGTDFGTAASSGNNNLGNAVFIVDAATGNKILSISGNNDGDNNANNNITITDMQFAIPSQLTVLDSDGNALADRIYFGDTGGQVWRIDLGNDIAFDGTSTTAATSQTVVGRLATIADSTDPAGYRRFFERPSVVEVLDTQYADGIGGEYDYVLIGSGYRPHPLDETVADRFYAFRDTTTGRMTAQAGTNQAQDYPVVGSNPISHTTNNQLVDVSTMTLEDIANDSNLNIEVGDALGWYLDFNTITNTTEGEKVLSTPVVLAGTIAFTTYVPDAAPSSDPCSTTSIGSSRAYNLDVLSTRANIDWEGSNDPIKGRRTTLGSGIASSVVPIFTKEGVIGLVNYDRSAKIIGKFSGLPRYETYWYDES